MKILARVSLAVVVACIAAGCVTKARQPVLYSPKMTPETLHPGDSAILTVRTRDLYHIIRSIEGIVREDPRVTFKLRDDGQGADREAGDAIWTLQVDVPFQAPPGDFVLELTAYDADGNPIPVKNEAGETVPLTTTLDISIRIPNEE